MSSYERKLPTREQILARRERDRRKYAENPEIRRQRMRERRQRERESRNGGQKQETPEKKKSTPVKQEKKKTLKAGMYKPFMHNYNEDDEDIMKAFPPINLSPTSFYFRAARKSIRKLSKRLKKSKKSKKSKMRKTSIKKIKKSLRKRRI